jgi:hypothetical protein
MQNGSMMRTERHGGPDVWEFRWREPGPDGNVNIAGWSLVQRMSSATKLRLAKRLRAFISV